MRDLNRFAKDLHDANSPAEIEAVLLRDDIECVLESWKTVLDRPYDPDFEFQKGYRTAAALVIASIENAIEARDQKRWVA